MERLPPCPELEELLAHVDAPASGPAADSAGGAGPVARHLAEGCPRCERRVAGLRRLLAAEGTAPLAAVPAAVARRAERIPADERERPGVGARVASLVRDLLGGEATPALRGAALDERHLLFRADPFDVDVAVLDGSTLVGQVLADDAATGDLAGASCHLYGAGARRVAELEASGEFQFEDLAPGVYDLVIETGGEPILVRGIDLVADPRGEAP